MATDYYGECFEAGLQYQDYVVDAFLKFFRMPLPLYQSKFYQREKGESACGVEIKYDRCFASTRHLWIELAEKTSPEQESYRPSGVNCDAWLYIIGDYEAIFLFGTKTLRTIAVRYSQIENNRGTSLGYLLPEAHARHYALRALDIDAGRELP